jgi:hypothetical protein
VTNYKVVVRRGAIIYEGESLSEANRSFENFVSESKESEVLITLFQESKIVRQWYRHLNPDLHCHALSSALPPAHLALRQLVGISQI